MGKQRIRLWDLPTRLFHWSLVILVVASFVSGKLGGNAMNWHGKLGLAILGLLSFRVVWGIVGSSYARFAQFFPTPASVFTYLRGQWQGEGHNPVGSLSVFALLAVLGFQVGTSLFGNDDIAFRGPLYDLISKDLSDQMISLHGLSVNLLLAIVALHLAAITFYTHVKKNNLIKPMLTGWKEVDEGGGESATGGGLLAFLAALLIAMASVYGGSGAWLPAAPPAPASVPAW